MNAAWSSLNAHSSHSAASCKLLAVSVLLALMLALTASSGDEPTPDASNRASEVGDGSTQIDTAGAEGDLAVGLQAAVEDRHNDAVAALNRVLEEDPENLYALYNIGQVEQARGNNAEAENYYRQALDVEFEYTPALFNLAIILSARNDHQGAAELYQRVTEIEPENANAFLNLDEAGALNPDLAERLPD